MQKVLIGIVATLLIIVGAAYAVGLTKDDVWHIEESIVINTSPKHIYPIVTDLKSWAHWTAWSDESDPEVVRGYEGTPNTVGYGMTWDGPKLGKGHLVLKDLQPNKSVTYDLFFDDSDVGSVGKIIFVETPEGTKVTWTDDLIMESPFMRLAAPTIIEMVSKDFVNGLEGLNKAALAHAANHPDPPPLAETVGNLKERLEGMIQGAKGSPALTP